MRPAKATERQGEGEGQRDRCGQTVEVRPATGKHCVPNNSARDIADVLTYSIAHSRTEPKLLILAVPCQLRAQSDTRKHTRSFSAMGAIAAQFGTSQDLYASGPACLQNAADSRRTTNRSLVAKALTTRTCPVPDSVQHQLGGTVSSSIPDSVV